MKYDTAEEQIKNYDGLSVWIKYNELGGNSGI